MWLTHVLCVYSFLVNQKAAVIFSGRQNQLALLWHTAVSAELSMRLSERVQKQVGVTCQEHISKVFQRGYRPLRNQRVPLFIQVLRNWGFLRRQWALLPRGDLWAHISKGHYLLVIVFAVPPGVQLSPFSSVRKTTSGNGRTWIS